MYMQNIKHESNFAHITNESNMLAMQVAGLLFNERYHI